jgi:hypothetical protein
LLGTSDMSSATKKLILVIGATGAQGIAVVNGLLAPAADGSPSPYSVRALTRDTSSERARALTSRGVECVQGWSGSGPGREGTDNVCDQANSMTYHQSVRLLRGSTVPG